MVWPKGRLTAIEADGLGEHATIAFVCPGRRLLANALTARGGRLLVEAADLGGSAVPGRSFAECDPVILRFRLDRAKLYWIDFD